MKLLKVKTTKKADADADPILSKTIGNFQKMENDLSALRKTLKKHKQNIEDIFKNVDTFDDNKYKQMRGTLSEVRFQAQKLLDMLTNFEDDIDKTYRQNMRSA